MKRSFSILLLWWAACGNSGDADPPGDPDAGPADAGQPGAFLDPLVPLGSLPAQGVIEAEELRAMSDGRLAYCTREHGVIVVDASDPANPGEIARIDTGPCQHLAVSADTLYVAHRGDAAAPASHVTAYDLAQSPPVAVGTLDGAGRSFEGIVADGDLVYAAVHDRGLAIIERAGNALIERGSLTTGFVNAWGVDKHGDHVFVADAGAGLVVVDVSDPAAPTRAGSVDIDGSPMSIDVSDDGAVAYVGAGFGGVFAIDVQSPDAPVVRGEHSTRGSAFQVSWAGDHLYVADWRALRVFDTTDPGALALIATELPPATGTPRLRAVAARDREVFVAEWTALHAYELQPDRRAPDLWVHDTEVAFHNIPVDNRRAFALIVRNDGTAPLHGTVAIEGAPFSTTREVIEMEPDGAAVVEVTYQPPDGQVHTGAVVLRSDDPDQPELRVPITGNGPYPQVGDPAPDIAVAMIYGGEWRTEQHRGIIQVLSYFSVF